MRTYVFESDSLDPYTNLACEETILRSLQPGELTLYLWRNERTVVIGRNQNPWRECRLEQLNHDGGRLARRPSGGGAVYHDSGNLNFTFAAADDMYNVTRQMKVIIAALSFFGVHATLTGRNDIEVDGAKVSGNAFFRIPGARLHHGTLMISVDSSALEHYLSPDPRKLAAKGVASVRSRVANLKDLSPDITPETLAQALKKAFTVAYGNTTEFPAERLDPVEQARRRDRFASDEWLLGETISSSQAFGERFTWGSVDLELAVKDGVIEALRVWSDALDADWIDEFQRVLVGCHASKDALIERLNALPADTPEHVQMRDDCHTLIQDNM